MATAARAPDVGVPRVGYNVRYNRAMTQPASTQPESGHRARPGAAMGAAEWDARYAGSELVWGAGANRFVVEHTADWPPGRAVDLACGEGRNALYLAGRGWQVTGVDFSTVAVEKARRLEQAVADPGWAPVHWACADVTDYRPDPADLALLAYLHLPPESRRATLANAVGALAPGGRVLVIGHNTRNIAEGAGGPQDPEILYTAADIVTDLAAIDAALAVQAALEPLRAVPGAPRPAIDTVVLARRP